MGIALALLAAFFASITNILAKIGIKNIHSNLATAIRTIIVLMMAFFMVIITGKIETITTLSVKSFLFLVLSGLSTGLSWLLFFKALSIGDVSKVVPIDKASIVLTLLLSFIVLDEAPTPLIVSGGALISLGTFILISKDHQKHRYTRSQSYLLYAIFGAVFASLTSILAKIGLEDIDSNTATFIRTIVILIFSWSIVLVQRSYKEMKLISKKSYIFLILSGMATGLSWICYFAALAIADVSIVAPIDKFSVVLTMVLGFVILKEKPTKETLVGGFIITIGTVLLIL